MAGRYPVDMYANKTMPDNGVNLSNQIVIVQVLDKDESIYKILVNGSVYQANLPVSVSTGESLLAKITGYNPVVLQLDKLAAEDELNDANLSRLSEKLASKATKNSIALLKELIRNNEVILKSKFLKLLKLINGAGINLEGPKTKILPYLFWEPDNYSVLTGKNINYFTHSIEELQNMVFGYLAYASGKLNKAGEIDDLFEAVTIEADGDKKNLIEKHKKLSSIDSALINWLNTGAVSNNKNLNEISSLLLIYLFQKKFYKRKNISPEFFILNHNPELELVQYQIKKRISNNIAETFAVNFNFSQTDKTVVNAELILNGQNSNIHLPEMLLEKLNLHSLLKELPAGIKIKYDLPVKVMFKNNINGHKTDSLVRINATI